MLKIYHVINPYLTDKSSEEYQIQQRTIDSISAAIAYAAGFVDVRLVAKVEPAEVDHYRDALSQLPASIAALGRTSADIGVPFEIPRRLPVLDDLTDLRGLIPDEEFAETSGAYLVVTNMDICLQPFFYTEVARILGSGTDCFVINRRTLDKGLLHRDLPESYTASGEKHIGHDCFVIPLSLRKDFVVKPHILGIGFVFRPFLLNCILLSRNFHEFDDAYLTFHYGDDMIWKSDKYADYLEFNKQLLVDVYSGFEERICNATPAQARWLSKFFSFGFLPKF